MLGTDQIQIEMANHVNDEFGDQGERRLEAAQVTKKHGKEKSSGLQVESDFYEEIEQLLMEQFNTKIGSLNKLIERE